MLKREIWSWDKAVEGMQVFLVDPNNIQIAISGSVSEVKRSNKYRMIDGKAAKSMQVVSVTFKCAGGKEITVTKSAPQYQIIMK